MLDGLNESIYNPDEESGLNLRKGTPVQKSFEKVDVVTDVIFHLSLSRFLDLAGHVSSFVIFPHHHYYYPHR